MGKFNTSLPIVLSGMLFISLVGCEQRYDLAPLPQKSGKITEADVKDVAPGIQAAGDPAENAIPTTLPGDVIPQPTSTVIPQPTSTVIPQPTSTVIPLPTSSVLPDIAIIPSVTPTPTPTVFPYVIPDTGSVDNIGCMPSPAAIVAFSNASVVMQGNSDLHGSIVIFEKTRLTVGGNAQVNGPVYYDPASSIVVGVPSSQLFQVDNTIEREILNYINGLSLLKPTQEISGITGSKTIMGNGKLNVISIPGDLHLSATQQLVLDGTASDVFVINISGEIRVTGHASIALANGVQAKNVVFNAIGAGKAIQLAGGGKISGTFVGLLRGASIGGSGVLNGSIYSSNSISIKGSGQAWNPVVFCSSK
ncbi:MAG TPA: hypothetical protein DIS93_03935 [Bdellovibrionales bacterium]|nr:hypothetical protein [Bdellovibrionales bacterium]